jgi:uncharacterized membrane protein
VGKNRIEVFSDGVIAIIITTMVLELKPPHGGDFRALLPLWPVFMSYVFSFIYVGIYWNKLQYGSYPTATSRRLLPNRANLTRLKLWQS